MPETHFDPELMQDFLTESGELLDQLDHDLVTLESSPQDLELLNRIFRALHTIKGSASFLTLTNLVAIAHAAEGALNAARNAVFVVDRPAMDMLLAAVDTIKTQFDDIRAARALTAPDKILVARLTALGEGKGAAARAPAHPAPQAAPAPAQGSAPVSASTPTDAGSERPLQLPSSKSDLLDYLVEDVDQTLRQIEEKLKLLTSEADRPGAASALSELSESLCKSADFFEFEPMHRLANCLVKLGEHATELDPAQVCNAIPSAQQVLTLLRQQQQGLAARKAVAPPMEKLVEQFKHLDEFNTQHTSPANPAGQPDVNQPDVHKEPADHHDAKGDKNAEKIDKSAAGEATIRVEVSRLETLLNLVGELVLQKNRVSALTRQIVGAGSLGQNLREQCSETSGSLDRVTSDLQVAVMKTRMQPLDKLFGKYPRLIRDLARKLNKQIDLHVGGGQTEVDKSVIEELGDPLVHLMRNSADHGIETPEARAKAGKNPQGTISLTAANAGGHVEIIIRDDGKGIDPAFISRKALEKGVVSEAQLATMSDREKMNLIFAPGFSTAEKLSDVSGRGVGMDVVKTNIEKIKGTIEIDSVVGQGTTMCIKIPLTVAILSAMMVGVRDEIYAVPLSNITEIVKPTEAQLGSINQRPVLRLRNTVLPLLSAVELFGVPERAPAAGQDDASTPQNTPQNDEPFAVVIASGERRIGLLVSSLIGQQEVVIKPLDRHIDRGGPVSGATVRDDGGVSLIVDIQRLFNIAAQRAAS